MGQILEIATEKGRLRDGQYVTYKGHDGIRVYCITSVDTFTAFYPEEDGHLIEINVSDKELSF